MKPEPPMARPPVPAVAFKPEWAAFQAKQTVVTGVRSEIAASWQRSMQSNLSATLPGPPLDEAALRGFDHGGTAASSSSPPAASWPIGWCPSSATRPPRSLSATTSAWSSTGPADRRCCAPPSTSIWCREASGLSRRPVRTGSGSRSGGSAHVYGAEHSLESLHGFSCTAAIVRHPVTREPLGVLGLGRATLHRRLRAYRLLDPKATNESFSGNTGNRLTADR